jgi:hypothetical protein
VPLAVSAAIGSRDDEQLTAPSRTRTTSALCGLRLAQLDRETLHRLEKLDADEPGFDDELATLMGAIRHHIEEEEGEMFAQMRQVMDPEELRKLGSRVEAFKKVATRPHPHVPNEALPRAAAGPAASLFDRLRDLATDD